MPSELRDLPADFSGEARLFPLPNLVFFPHNIQPLHIFESRYREMMKDALNGDQLITLATLMPGYEVDYYSRPPVAPVACVGRISHYEETENGTYNLLLAGLHRVRLGPEITPFRSFRRARFMVLAEEQDDLSGSTVRQTGQRLSQQLVRVVPGMTALAARYRHGQLTLGVLTDVVAFHLPLPLPIKLDLLAEPHAVHRAERLIEQLSAAEGCTGKAPFPPTFGPN